MSMYWRPVHVKKEFSTVAGEWYPAIEYPYPKVYHRFINEPTFEIIYPELINATSVEDIERLIENAGEDEVVKIKLKADITDAETIVIASGKNVILELNGFTISAAEDAESEGAHVYAIENAGTLNIVGPGTIEGRGVSNTGNLEINKNPEIKCIDADGGAAIWNEGTVIVNNGTFRATEAGDPSDESGPGCLNNSGVCTINGGQFISVNTRTYAVISSEDITVNDAVVTGTHGGLSVEEGVAVVNGGTFTGTNYYGMLICNDVDGQEDPELPDVLITNGTFVGNEYSVWIGNDATANVKATIKIEEADFTSPVKQQKLVDEGAGIVAYPETEYEFVDQEDETKELVKKEADSDEPITPGE